MRIQEPERPMSVLAAEDNPVFQSMLRHLLTKWGYRVIAAREGNEAWKLLSAANAPRMAILDWMMPGMDGVEVCRRVRCAGREPYQYILLLTARTESQDLVEGMDAGADDYLTKPFHPQELRVRLRAGRRILELQEELVLAREALREQATHDDMTGLLNRTAVLEALRNEAERAGREGRPLSVLLADFDYFKRINDTYGHLAGDAVLREGARRMKAAIRRYDALGRYGGEEFLAALPNSDSAAALAQATRLREAVEAEPFSIGGVGLAVTCSVGIATIARPDARRIDALIREADTALYRAKHAGRNRVEAFQ
ncbi:MAG TPA: diguanylate cyclase [Bryobacteraceae bacterium]|nr:diguanylate cyclase [Bryobacteraceae bacterium]